MSARPDPAAFVPPSAPIKNLRRRAELLAATRRFFSERAVMEVETPLLGRGLVVDAHIDPVTCEVDETADGLRYLLPSPEAPMKRLLVAGSGPIYALAKSFRAAERGRHHQPEFTMLEWYRPGMDYVTLIDEVDALVTELLDAPPAVKRTHRDVFRETLGVDVHTATAEDLEAVARDHGIEFGSESGPNDRGAWIDALYATVIEPRLDPDVPTFVYDFPAEQAALATVRAGDPPVAQRFELIYRGMELCNGYEELLDAATHRARFDEANAVRSAMGKPAIRPDDALVGAIERGLPPCSGVAVGFDRLVMIACGASNIAEVVAFVD